jgi:hypothetical protein
MDGVSGSQPLVPFAAVGPNGKAVHDAALIDTGAAFSVFPSAWMVRLGIDREESMMEVLETAAGTTSMWSGPPVELTIVGESVPITPCFADVPIVLFSLSDALRGFEVTFDHPKMMFSLRKASP